MYAMASFSRGGVPQLLAGGGSMEKSGCRMISVDIHLGVVGFHSP